MHSPLPEEIVHDAYPLRRCCHCCRRFICDPRFAPLTRRIRMAAQGRGRAPAGLPSLTSPAIHGIVAAGHPLAAMAGLQMMLKGWERV